MDNVQLLPVFIAACRSLLVMHTTAWRKRLWCLSETANFAASSSMTRIPLVAGMFCPLQKTTAVVRQHMGRLLRQRPRPVILVTVSQGAETTFEICTNLCAQCEKLEIAPVGCPMIECDLPVGIQPGQQFLVEVKEKITGGIYAIDGIYRCGERAETAAG